MLKKSLVFLLVLGLAVLLTSPGAEARKGPRHGHGPDIIKHAGELNLTDDQLSRVKDIRFDTKKKLIDFQADLKKARLEQHELWDNGIPTEKQLNKHIDKVSTLTIKIRKIRAASRIQEMKVLTEEQLSEFKKIKVNKSLFLKRHKGFGKSHSLKAHSGCCQKICR